MASFQALKTCSNTSTRFPRPYLVLLGIPTVPEQSRPGSPGSPGYIPITWDQMAMALSLDGFFSWINGLVCWEKSSPETIQKFSHLKNI